jgi:hypothetical protein
MNEYNERWTREKFLEYRKLKRSGYTHKMLIEHFGDDIDYSGLYNKNAHIIPYDYFTKYFENKINEIRITPEQTEYDITPVPSNLALSKMDYLLTFISGEVSYTICLMYYKIHTDDTYNVIFTTTDQWNEYRQEFFNISKKSRVSQEEWELLNNIIGRQTGYNDLFPLFRKMSWILLDFYYKYIRGAILSIGDTKDEKKINLYRNIIKDSFDSLIESETVFNDSKYYLYTISNP